MSRYGVLDAIFAKPPKNCDNCGEILDRDGTGPFYRPQALPPGETIHGRAFIAICGGNACLRTDTDGAQ